MRYSLELKKAVYSQETGAYPIILFTIEDSTLAEPLYLSTDATERLPELSTDRELVYGTRSNGKNYVYFPMEWTLPDDDETSVPSFGLSIANVGSELTKAIREMQVSPTVKMDFVLSTNVDFVESAFSQFRLSSVTMDQMSVSGDLTLDLMLNDAFPMHTCTPATTPGLFQA